MSLYEPSEQEQRGDFDQPRFGERNCRSCGRPSLSLEDGECPGCLNDSEAQYQRRRAEIEKIPRYRRIAEGWRQSFPDQAEALLAYVAHLERGIK